ncbi:MAG: exo-beta-1,3-glucanase, partial [Methylovulum sp.]
AGPKNQAAVIESTFKKLAQQNRSGVVFEAFSEDWKPSNEGNFGRFWGLCQGEPPYPCNKEFSRHR